MTLQENDPGTAATTPAAVHPDSVHAPAWKSNHAMLTLTRWADGWKGTVDLWRHGVSSSLNDWTTDDRRTYSVSFGPQSPLSDCELIRMAWTSCHLVCRELEGRSRLEYESPSCSCRPPVVPWVKLTAGITPMGNGANLYAYLTAKGHSSSKPNERRLCSVDMMPLGPVVPVTLISSLGYLLEQHAQ
jgi:hypothetical protein